MKNYAKSVVTVGLLVLNLAAVVAAQTLSGTVTNGTTNKPAAGDEVILINISNGMDVAANTKADSSGKFSFTLKDGPGPHLIRAVHQGVTYHQMAPPGTNSVAVNVYDVAKKVPEIQVTADVMRFQAEGGTLQGIRLFAVNNNSSPPRTQMNDHNFEFYLPAGAKIDQAQAKAPNGQPIAAETAPQSEKNRYAVVFPLRPGETQIQVQFTMPYSGSLKFDPKPLYPAEHAVVVIPKSMQFEAANASQFQAMNDPSQGDTTVEVAQQTQPGQSLAYTIKGTGTINESPQQVAAGAAQGQKEGMSNRPGGGLGTPIDTPDPLQQYRWWILGGFAIVLAAGGWYVTRTQVPVPLAEQYCPNCGVVATPQFRVSGSKWTEIILWVLGIVPGIIYTVWRLSTKRWVCPKCDQTGMIPLDSPNVPPKVASSVTAGISTSHARIASGPLAAPVTGAGPSKISGKVSANLATQTAVAEAAAAPATTAAGPKSSMLLEALKEEMFQLELERRTGKITESEYEKTKAALDQTLDRALKRQG